MEGATGARATAPSLGASSVTDAVAWRRLWAIAMLAHVLSNGLDPALRLHDLPNAGLGLVALVVVVRPVEHHWFTAMLSLAILSVAAEAPTIGNHWILAGAISGLALVARPWSGDDDWWRRFAPGARMALLVFYSFAAFAKLNSGFFDPVVSCSRFFANQSLSLWQLPEVGAGSPVAEPLAWVTALVELSVPLLLICKRTRSIGVWLGVAFHLLLTLDLVQHFFDFTMVLVPLFLLFAPAGTLATLDRRLPRLRRPTERIWIVIGALMVLATTLGPTDSLVVLGLLATWLAWLVLLVVLVRALVLHRPAVDNSSLSFRPTSFAALAIIALVVVNGLSPYLELKSSFGFNMYSNLVTAGGETNHFVVPGTLELRDDQSTLAIVLASSDDGLAEYIDSGFGLPLANLRDYFADHLDISATFVVDGETIELERVGDHPEWLDRRHWALERFAPFRAVPVGDMPACQPSFLVAG